MKHMIPLPGAVMITSMLGFLITTVYTISGRLDQSWGFAFNLVFVIMFVASILSITPDPLPKASASAKVEIRKTYGRVKTRKTKPARKAAKPRKAKKRRKR